jgi:di/tricarboxylate transporter
MWFVFLLYAAAFLFFFNEKSWKIPAALTSSFLTVALVSTGLIDSGEVYRGFSENAVVTVVLMLILTGVLERSGVIGILVYFIGRYQILNSRLCASLFVIVVMASAIMNDVGALAIVIPGALALCQKLKVPPATVLMPLSFGSLLGGTLTKVGTPPNIIISEFREEVMGEPFRMFDYLPAGLLVCIAGGITILLLRKHVFSGERYQVLSKLSDHPLTRGFIPLMVPENSPLINKKVGAAKFFDAEMFFPRAVLRKTDSWKCFFSKPWDKNLLAGDILMIRVDLSRSEEQKELLEEYVAMKIFAHVPDDVQKDILSHLQRMCCIDRRSSLLKDDGTKPAFRDMYDLLRLKDEEYFESDDEHDFFEGKVLVFIGEYLNFKRLIRDYRLIELNEGQISVEWPRFRRVMLIFGMAILLSSLALLKVQLALGLAVLVFLAIRELNWDHVSKSLDIPLIILIGTMLVNAQAFVNSGGAEWVSGNLLSVFPGGSPYLILSGMILATMALTNIISNAACAAMMAPVGIAVARSMGVSADPFLMGICIASSCAFLSPIGHQCNMLVYKVGHYDFKCYFRLGIWVSFVVWITASLGVPIFWKF